ncbi:MAG: PAS domain S-box protein, partial [Deltaproteobacteria bacterium]|nr:PAS domain S-box protein [Deltaproteobacteria bacterium]
AGVDVVGQAQNLSAAVEAVRTISPDVVILDIHMPEGSGIEVLRALKKSQPAPLVIMLTNYPFLQFRQRCLAEGADFFLDKSTEFEKVPGLLEDLQQRSAPPAESISISKQAEKTSDPQELKEADPRYQSLFESLPLGLCLITPAGHILDANPALVRLLGYPDQETLLAVNAASLYVDPEERQRWQDLVEREGVVQNFAMQLCRYDGTLIWVQHSTRAIRDAAGQVLYYEAAAENITARKRAEEALAERTRLAELGAEVGAALTQSDDLRSALHRCVEAMVQHLDAAFARIWTLNPAQNVLELQASAGLYTHLDGPHSRVPVGQFKIGLIAQERQPHLTNAVIGDPGVSDQEWAKREGMVAFAGYPLIVEAHLVGVVAMFARQPLTEFTLKALAAVADEIALGIERKQAEEALRANERRFRALIENSSDTIALVTSDGTIVYTSPSVRRVLGYTEHELIGSSAFALIHPEEREYTRGLLAELLQNSGDTIIAQVRVQHKNGLWQWIEAVGQNLLAEPSVQAVVINYRDISERKQAEELLRHAEARYRSIFEHVVEGIFQTTPDGRFLTANPAMARILGYESPADLLENVSDIGQQVYAEPARRTEFQRILSEAGVVQGFEARFYRKDRSLIWTSLSAHAVRDASGALLYYEGTIEDVTARKQAEEALQVEAQISAALARVGQELIASFDKPTMLERLCQLITEVLDCDQSSTILWQPRDGVYVLAANYGHVTEQVETLRSLRVSPQVAAWLTTRLEEQEVVEVETATVPDFVARTLLQQVGTTALLYITLRRGGKFIGVQTAAYRGRRGFSAAQQRIARGIAHLASFALDNAQLLEQAESVNLRPGAARAGRLLATSEEGGA